MSKLEMIEKMSSIHSQITAELEGDPIAKELYNELLEASVKYIAIRAKWSIMDREEKIEKDSLRTSLHNDVILQVNVLARYLRQAGKPTLWREELGDEKKDPMCRKIIGDFACYLSFVHGICAR